MIYIGIRLFVIMTSQSKSGHNCRGLIRADPFHVRKDNRTQPEPTV